MSATAGYVTPSTPGFKMVDGSFLTPDSVELRSCYNLTHGALIGYTNGSITQGPPVSEYDPEDYWDDYSESYQHWNDSTNDPNFKFKDADPLFSTLTRCKISLYYTHKS